MATEPTLDEALAAAHLPALVVSLAQLTGDDSWLRPEWKPTYVPFPRGDIGLSEEIQQQIRDAARGTIEDFLAGKIQPVKHLPESTIRKMMDFIAGQEIPQTYVDFLIDELALEGVSTKDAHWEAPQLKAAARRMHVVVIGAGMSGIVTGVRLSQAGIDFEIIEKNPDVGGTWLENIYPGCRVDSSNHMYSYSFEPNHQWPQHFSPQPVLLAYFRGVADRYDLRKHIRFETEVIEAVFDEARSLWKVQVRHKDGREETIEATTVITAVGQLNRPRLPEIKGRDSFAGPSFHSAQWRQDIDLTGKRVAVIGTGASAFQIVPEIARKVKSLTIFQRTPPWIFPTPHYHEDVPEGMKWLLETIPFYDKWYRFFLFWMATDGLLAAVRADPGWNGPPNAVGADNAMYGAMIVEALKAQVGEKTELLDKVIPQYPLGGKRALLDNGAWINALKGDNVEIVTNPIVEITPTGVVTKDGTEHAVDVIIFATGFTASKFLSPMRIVGRRGVALQDQWNGDPRAYLGMTTPGFPNLFMIYGPNTNIVVNGSIIFFSECSVRYIIGCLKLLAETGARTIECRREVHDAFNEKVDAGNRLMAWGSPQVTSWYKNAAGRVTQNWPFALVDYWRATLAPDPKDFVLEKDREAVG
ncbi:MAG TPA: NAD(P)/FAD-dependent oxidoreductase [Caulobacteraceae bacterium]|nr:NAD(P)/FAD-dependent oxidoreductase [Caulobacteraceae bacterium]